MPASDRKQNLGSYHCLKHYISTTSMILLACCHDAADTVHVQHKPGARLPDRNSDDHTSWPGACQLCSCLHTVLHDQWPVYVILIHVVSNVGSFC